MDLDALLASMTLDEKLAQLGCVWCSALVDETGFSPRRAERWLTHGIGEITRIGATTGLRPRERAQLANAIQHFLADNTRLGIPAIVHEESTAGLCARDATQFPQAIGLASTWDPDLLEQIGVVIREQMVATGARHTLAPVLDVARDARWGRVEETYGESPYLVSRLGVAYVRGVQGDLGTGVAATGKHFLGYAMSEGGLNHAPVHFGARELREVYAEPFRAAIAEAGLATVMNSYSSVDGLACGGSRAILEELLRGELGFTGTVVADYSTTEWLISHHRVAADKGEAARVALSAGLDMELPQLDCYGAPLKTLVERGDVDVALVDRSVRRVLALKDTLGLFENPFVDEDAVTRVYMRDADRDLARRAAAESLVLLQNDGVLPLRTDMHIAVIGPAADDQRLLQGDYSYPAHTEIVQPRDAEGKLIETKGDFAAGPYYPEAVTPLAGIRAASTGTVTFAKGCGVRSTRTDGFAEAVEIARAADVALCFVGGRSGLMPDCTSGEFRDVSDLALPGAQEELVEAIVATGTPTVLVVVSGRPHALTRAAAGAAAILYAWVPGEQGGNALADVLFGVRAPVGRLPVSLPRTVGQVPLHHDVRAGGGRSAIYGDYVDGPAAPYFPFGFGLSYTTFEYDELVVDDARTDAPFDVRVNVTNSGARTGVEVVQLFARDDVARVARPERQLVGFTKVELEPGATCTVRFTVDPTAFAYYDEAMRLVVEPGDITLFAGNLRTTFGLDGPEREIKPNDRQPSRAEA